jgi:Guanosine polyphosphate pyrophosphohydrolases/synthetases
MLNKAIEIAAIAHIDQVDKAGEPYILHPLRVMLSCTDELERVCAVLHDVVEDSTVGFEDLRTEGFSEAVIEVLDCLTKRNGESYDAFIERVLKNKTASQVKLADINDNMNLSRIKNPTEKDRQRITKYEKAVAQILQAWPSASI